MSHNTFHDVRVMEIAVLVSKEKDVATLNVEIRIDVDLIVWRLSKILLDIFGPLLLCRGKSDEAGLLGAVEQMHCDAAGRSGSVVSVLDAKGFGVFTNELESVRMIKTFHESVGTTFLKRMQRQEFGAKFIVENNLKMFCDLENQLVQGKQHKGANAEEFSAEIFIFGLIEVALQKRDDFVFKVGIRIVGSFAYAFNSIWMKKFLKLGSWGVWRVSGKIERHLFGSR